MILPTLLLTISTCMSSGVSNIVQANRIEAIKEQAVQVVADAVDSFNYSNFVFDYEEYASVVKQKLYNFNKENNLIDDSHAESLVENLKMDFSYISAVDFDSIVLAKNISSLNLSNEVDFTKTTKFCVDEFIQQKDVINCASNLNKDVNNKFISVVSNSSDDKTISDASNKETDKFPIHSYNATNISTYINGEVGGKKFIGIAASKDACVAFYNTVARWLNNMAFYKASGIKGPAGIIYETVKTLTLVAGGTALATAITSVVSSITTYFIGLWAQFISLFTAGGPIGILVGIIISIIGAACVGTLVTMFIFGYLQKGFAVGWKIHNIFKWEWYCGELA